MRILIVDDKDEAFAYEIGADGFLRKGMEPADFLTSIHSVIKNLGQGRISPKSPVQKPEEKTYKHYSERLIQKLEKKIQDLEKRLELRKQDEKTIVNLNAAVAHSPNIVMITDNAGNIEYVNPKFEEITGYTAREILGTNAASLGRQSPEKHEQMLRDLHDGQVWKGIFHNRKKNGESYWERASISPMFGDNGSITHFVKVGDDMTREKALTDALKEKEERLNMALEASRDGLWDWNMQTGEIYFSPRYSTMLGYDPDELPRSYDTWVGLLHPDDREKAEKMIRDHIKKESGPFEQEFRMKTKSGKWKWILGKGKVFSVDANGRPIRVVGTHTDITEKKKTERELKIRNQIARIFLTTPGDEIYDKILALVLDMTQSRYGIFGFVSEANEWVCPSLTREIWEQCQVPDKQITFPHAAWTGIWGQAMAEKKCRYVNRTLHLPEGHIAIENALDAPLVYKGGERAKELVMQILAFSRQQEQDAAPTQIGPIVKEAIKFLKATLPSYIEIHQRIIPDPGMILADPTRIHQVLMNLCTNAAQAMDRAGGTLTVTLDRVTLDAADVAVHPDLAPGKYLKLMVQDTGHGITTDILPKIFDPYFTTKRRGKGTGMGLATAHGIITSCGGAITVYSEPGQGTTFHVYFPVAEKPAGTRTAPPGSAPAPTGSGDGTGADVFAKGDAAILFVDDEPAIAKLGKHLLENLGYRVESRTDPLAALALVKDNPGRFDLVITDMTMPGMSGDRLARELITLRPDLPVILCSGFSVELSEHEAATAGIKAFIMKPLLKDKLAQTIKTVLSSRSLTKKNTNLQEKQDKEFP